MVIPKHFDISFELLRGIRVVVKVSNAISEDDEVIFAVILRLVHLYLTLNKVYTLSDALVRLWILQYRSKTICGYRALVEHLDLLEPAIKDSFSDQSLATGHFHGCFRS